MSRRITARQCEWNPCYMPLSKIWHPAPGKTNRPIKVCDEHGAWLIGAYPGSALMTCIG